MLALHPSLHGKKVTYKKLGRIRKNAIIVYQPVSGTNGYFLCQDYDNGYRANNTMGYKFSWYFKQRSDGTFTDLITDLKLVESDWDT